MIDQPQVTCTRVGLVEDNREVREGIQFIVESSPELQCVYACASAEEAIESMPDTRPNVILLDLDLAGEMSGVDAIQPLKACMPNTAIIILSIYEDPDKIFPSLRLGARGYLTKSAGYGHLRERIKEAHNGHAPMSAEIARMVLEAFQNPAPADEASAHLSPSQTKIVELLSQGHTRKETAALLNISPETVKKQCHKIYEKLNVSCDNQIVSKVYPTKKWTAVVRQLWSGDVV